MSEQENEKIPSIGAYYENTPYRGKRVRQTGFHRQGDPVFRVRRHSTSIYESNERKFEMRNYSVWAYKMDIGLLDYRCNTVQSQRGGCMRYCKNRVSIITFLNK